MFKVYNKDTRTIYLPSLWCLYCWQWAYFTLCSSISTANFEHTIAGWVYKWPSTKTIIFLKSMKLFQLLSHFFDKSLFHTNFTTASLIKEIDLLLSQFQVIVIFAYTLETWTKSRAFKFSQKQSPRDVM